MELFKHDILNKYLLQLFDKNMYIFETIKCYCINVNIHVVELYIFVFSCNIDVIL